MRALETDDEWNWYHAMQHYGGPTRVYVLDPHWLVDLIDDSRAAKGRREVWNKKPKTASIDEDDRDGEYDKTFEVSSVAFHRDDEIWF
jgi:hypothetical protein